MNSVRFAITCLVTMVSANVSTESTKSPPASSSQKFEFRICFEGHHGRCFEGHKESGRIRQYGGRTDSEAPATEMTLAKLSAEADTLLKAAEAALKNLKPQTARRCAQPLKFQLRSREAVICLDQLEAVEKRSAKKTKVLPQILAFIDKLSAHSKPTKDAPKKS